MINDSEYALRKNGLATFLSFLSIKLHSYKKITFELIFTSDTFQKAFSSKPHCSNHIVINIKQLCLAPSRSSAQLSIWPTDLFKTIKIKRGPIFSYELPSFTQDDAQNGRGIPFTGLVLSSVYG